MVSGVERMERRDKQTDANSGEYKLVRETKGYIKRKKNITKIIDWETKGNVIRFYLGDEDNQDYWGDDWDDASFLYNAGLVYGNYIRGIAEIYVPFSCVVHNPSDDKQVITKKDFKEMKYPCLIVTDKYNVLYGLEDYWTYAEMDPECPYARYFYLNDRLAPGTYILSEDIKELKKI